jgi:hypothetical protein
LVNVNSKQENKRDVGEEGEVSGEEKRKREKRRVEQEFKSFLYQHSP